MTASQLDHRIDVLLRLREAAGEWVEVSQHKPGSSGARYAAMKWKRHCRETKWDAFEWETHGATLYGRFRGTQITPCPIVHRVGVTSKVFRKGP